MLRNTFKLKFTSILSSKKNLKNHLILCKKITKMPISYPKVRRDESIVESFHGVEVNFYFRILIAYFLIVCNINQIKDPYRWLEDPDSQETKKFVEEQNKLTNEFLNKCKYRTNIKNRFT